MSIDRLERAGLLARAGLYVLLGLVAAEVAFGRREPGEGALQAIAAQPLGRVLLGVLAAGLAAYAAGGAVEAVRGRRLRERLAAAAHGGWNAALAIAAGATAAGGGSRGGSRRAAAELLGLPFGRELVVAAGLGILAFACWNVWAAAAGRRRAGAEKGAGAAGHLARAAVFGLVGAFLVEAGWRYDPSEAVGLDGALAEVAAQPYGAVALVALAAGLWAYGAYLALRARHSSRVTAYSA